MNVDPIEVGRRIRNIRTNIMGLSMDDFGHRIDGKAKSGTVSNWETGKNLPNNKRLRRIAELGDMSVDELLYGAPIWEQFDEEVGKDGLQKLSDDVKRYEVFSKFFNEDVGQYLSFIITQLETDNPNLLFEDSELDDMTRKILKDSLQSNYDIAKRLNNK